ncbi:MAG TPA: lamin tail domain-containing protein [Candidatus Woesebacteria bacterium]|nr:lamin tail domain-containing protein [Candidatus Woesebacteria bacterium]
MLCIYPSFSYAIENSGFEQGETAWKKTNTAVEFILHSDQFKEGSTSAQITNTSTSSYGIEQIILDINPQMAYQITGFIKTGNPIPSKVFIRIAWYESVDGTGSQLKTEDSTSITNETDWQEITLQAVPPSNAKSAKIRLLLSNGTAYFDSVSIAELQITPTSSLKPTQIPNNQNIQNIFISEVMVYPNTNEPEWIELYNQNNFEVTLTNWFIDDIANGGASPKKFSITIPSFGYASIDLNSALFNNSGDEVRLLNNNGELVDSFAYETSEKNLTLGKHNNIFCLQTPSKNSSNNSCIESTQNPTPTEKIVATSTPAILGVTTVKKATITPTLKKTITKKFVFPTMQPKYVTTNTTEPAVIIPETETQNTHSSKPWLILSGSYSILAGISLVSKIVFFRYT